MRPAWVNTDRLIAGNDLVLQHYPWQVLFRELLAAGQFPFWNPYTFGGVPAFANPLMAYAYPPHWLLVWMPATPALNWLVGLHVVLAGLAAAWCAGRLGAGKEGQFAAGVAFGLGSAMTARVWSGHLALLEGLAWLPFATGLAIDVRQRRRFLLLPPVVALMVFAGQPEVLIFCLWWLPLWAGLAAGRDGWRQGGLALARVGLGLGLGFGLAAVQIVPTAELYAVTRRAGASSWDWTTMISMPPWHLLGALGPNVFGDADSYWPGKSYEWHDRLFFIGIVPLLAATRASGYARWICWLAAGIAIALALGRYSPWYAWAQAVLPGYQAFRVPSKHLALAALGLALAGSLGIHRLQGARVATAAVVAAAAVTLAGMTFEQWFPAAALLLGGSDRLVEPIIRSDVPGLARQELRTTSLLLLAAGAAALLSPRWAPRAQLLLLTLELGLVLGPYRAHLSDPRSIVAEAEPLRGHTRVAVVGAGGSILGNYGTVLGVTQPAGYLNLFSGGYSILASGAAQFIALDLARDDPAIRLLGYGVVYDNERRSLSVMEPPPPLAWVARCVWPGGPLDVRERTFPRQSCITLPWATERQPATPPGPATIVAQGPGWLHLEADGPGWLVTTQPWYPGWAATIDGSTADTAVLDGALVGVNLSPGRHRVTLAYRPAGLELGLLISLATGALMIAGSRLSLDNWPFERLAWRRQSDAAKAYTQVP